MVATLSSQGLDAAQAVVRSAVERGAIPGAVVLARHRGQVVLHQAFGFAALEPEPRPMALDTVFDLASMTKPLATATVILSLADRGLLSLDETIDAFLPELARHGRAGVSVRRLLTHCSGIPGWRPTYTWGRSPRAILDGLAQSDLAYRPGEQVEYSCLGFIVLGLLAERVTGLSLRDLVRDLLAEPLELPTLGYLPDLPATRFAASECGNQIERGMVERGGLTFGAWRAGYGPGQPNDGNAFYGLSGVSGNAGLFGSAEEVGILGELWLRGGALDGRRVLSTAAVELATSDQTPGLNAARGLGWQMNRRTAPEAAETALPSSSRAFFPPEWFDVPWEPRSCGEYLSTRAFGHTGFTGTSLWVDPPAELVVVLLANRLHPREHADGMPTIRARFHNAVLAAVAAARGGSTDL